MTDPLQHLRCLDPVILPCIALVVVTTRPGRSMHSFSFTSGNRHPENFRDRGDCIAYLRRTILSPDFLSSLFHISFFPVSFPCTLITNETTRVGAGRRSVSFMHTHVVYTPGSSAQIFPSLLIPTLIPGPQLLWSDERAAYMQTFSAVTGSCPPLRPDIHFGLADLSSFFLRHRCLEYAIHFHVSRNLPGVIKIPPPYPC